MSVNWTAVITGFAGTFALGFINGVVYAGTDVMVLAVSWAMIGVLVGSWQVSSPAERLATELSMVVWRPSSNRSSC